MKMTAILLTCVALAACKVDKPEVIKLGREDELAQSVNDDCYEGSMLSASYQWASYNADTEITQDEYENLRCVVGYLPGVSPAVNFALKDGKITYKEWRDIQSEQSRQWSLRKESDRAKAAADLKLVTTPIKDPRFPKQPHQFWGAKR